MRVLTDPVWGPRASPSRFAGPRRFQPVPVPLRAMPPVDLVVVSHDHYDHLDYPTIRELAKRDVPFVTSLGVGAHLEAWGVRPERIVDWPSGLAVGGGRLFLDATPIVRSAVGREIFPRALDVMETRSAVVLRALFTDPRFSVQPGSRRRFVRPALRLAARIRLPSLGEVSWSRQAWRNRRSRGTPPGPGRGPFRDVPVP